MSPLKMRRALLRHLQAGGVPHDDVDPLLLGEEEGKEPLPDESGDSGDENGGVAHGQSLRGEAGLSNGPAPAPAETGRRSIVL